MSGLHMEWGVSTYGCIARSKDSRFAAKSSGDEKVLTPPSILIKKGTCFHGCGYVLGGIMPLALGHLAVGFLTNCTIEKPKTTPRKRLFSLFLLTNSPDIDIPISWLVTGSPWPYHRTVTHSILFAIIIAAAFSNLFKFFPAFPKLSYNWCYLMVMGHVIADYLISPWKVAFLWPLSTYPESLNGMLDYVDRYATLAREAEVILICLLGYLLFKIFRAGANYLYRFLLPA